MPKCKVTKSIGLANPYAGGLLSYRVETIIQNRNLPKNPIWIWNLDLLRQEFKAHRHSGFLWPMLERKLEEIGVDAPNSHSPLLVSGAALQKSMMSTKWNALAWSETTQISSGIRQQ